MNELISPPRELLTAAEERFENARRLFGAIATPVAFALVYLFVASGLPPAGRRLSAILAATAVLWMTETISLPATALLGSVLCVLLGVASAKTVFAPFADPMIGLFLGSFILARAMALHALDRRIALAFLSIRWIGGRPGRVLAGMGVISAALSMWVSNTATTAMMMPIGVGILTAMHALRVSDGRLAPGPMNARAWPYATGMMLMIAYAASIGGIGTKVGSPPNLITLAQLERAGYSISFFKWMAIMTPTLLAMFALLMLLMYALHRDAPANEPAGTPKDIAPTSHGAAAGFGHGSPDHAAESERAGLMAHLDAERQRLGAWTLGQINTLGCFTLAVSLWILPGVVSALSPGNKRLAGFFANNGPMPEAIVALLAALLLFVLPADRGRRQFTMTWPEAAKIDWGTLILFGGGISLGQLMFDTHVADALGHWIIARTHVESLWALTAAAIVLGIFLSETTSNTAAATMLAPLIISIAVGLKVNPVAPALGACLGASYGFMLPVSTPPNAIVFGSGLVPIGRMIRAGILFDILGAVLIFAALRILCPLMQLTPSH